MTLRVISSKPDESTRNFFAATYAQPGGMRAGFVCSNTLLSFASWENAANCANPARIPPGCA